MFAARPHVEWWELCELLRFSGFKTNSGPQIPASWAANQIYPASAMSVMPVLHIAG